MNNKMYISWNHYIELCKNLASQIKKNEFTDIIAVSRGGLIPSQIIAYQLEIPRIHCAGMSTYNLVNEKTDIPYVYQEPTCIFQEQQKILIIDDVADTGHTLKALLDKYVNVEYKKCATLHFKPRSIIEPTFYVDAIDNDVWIVYPYEKIDRCKECSKFSLYYDSDDPDTLPLDRLTRKPINCSTWLCNDNVCPYEKEINPRGDFIN